MHGLKTMTWLVAGVMTAGSLFAAQPDSEEGPYAVIAKRNLFGLKDPPPPAAPPEAPKEPPSEVMLTGITTLLGIPKALLKLSIPAKPPEPARTESYILVEGGPAEGGIQVLKVDVDREMVRIRRGGQERWLKLEKDSSKPAAAAPTAVAAAGNPAAAAALARAQAARAPGGGAKPRLPGLPTRNVRATAGGAFAPTAQAGTLNLSSAPTLGSGTRSGVTRVVHDYGISPEEQVILIEKQRLETLQEQADGVVPPPPPTPFTEPELDPTTPAPQSELEGLLQGLGQ